MHKRLIFLLITVCIILNLQATPPDEGMWLPMFVERLNYTDMKKKGLKLTPEEIYSINSSSLKDAIVMLDGGSCTAEIVSPQGLLFTNHHCAYEALQSHSTVELNHLDNGFWAQNMGEELPNAGMTASLLVRMEDVTEQVLKEVNDDMSIAERKEVINKVSGKINTKASENGRYQAQTKGFFAGNEYYLFVYETFRDVRLVGAPPESIGKFGGDTDNWMWPRHTGDFALLRIYTAPDGSPADYSEKNIPLKPRHHLPVSVDGVKRGDFAMVLGFPGSTNRYKSSWGIEETVETNNPLIIKVRDKRLALMREDMNADPAVRLQYASKYAVISNYWKYFQGQNRGVERLDVKERKAALETQFANWVAADPMRKTKYEKALELLENGYAVRAATNPYYWHINESLMGSEILEYAYGAVGLRAAMRDPENNKGLIEELVTDFQHGLDEYFENYHAPTDQKVTTALLELFAEDVKGSELMPELFEEVMSSDGNFKKLVDNIFEKSIFSSKERMQAFLSNPQAEVILDDPVFPVINGVFRTYFQKVQPQRAGATDQINHGYRLFIAGLREMQPTKSFYPDANSTMRLTYGQVLDYFPEDAKLFSYYSTAQGIIQKEDPDNPEFVVPSRLRTLIQNKDYGQYAKNGRLRVTFITNNDITGGNSGSPVINGRGELIGIAFDGNWEAMSGGLAFEPDLQRCINVDIRYVLFIIDKYANAGHLINEMTIVDRSDKKTKEFEEVILRKY